MEKAKYTLNSHHCCMVAQSLEKLVKHQKKKKKKVETKIGSMRLNGRGDQTYSKCKVLTHSSNYIISNLLLYIRERIFNEDGSQKILCSRVRAVCLWNVLVNSSTKASECFTFPLGTQFQSSLGEKA